MTSKIDQYQQEFLAQVTIDDLSGDIRIVAELCGLDVAVRLIQKMGGTQPSVPRYALSRAAVRFIRARYDGTNANILALATGMRERFVFETVAQDPKKRDQYTLFEPPC